MGSFLVRAVSNLGIASEVPASIGFILLWPLMTASEGGFAAPLPSPERIGSLVLLRACQFRRGMHDGLVKEELRWPRRRRRLRSTDAPRAPIGSSTGRNS